MQPDDVKQKTHESRVLLRRAREMAEEAQGLDESNPKRKYLEESAQELIADARRLTQEAKRQVGKYSK